MKVKIDKQCPTRSRSSYFYQSFLVPVLSRRQLCVLITPSLLYVLTLCSGVRSDGMTELKYVWGDALTDPEALGPDGKRYPWDTATHIAGRSSRMPRSILEEDELPPLLTPEETKAALLAMFRSDLDANSGESSLTNSRNSPAVRTYHRQGRSETTSPPSTTSTTSAPDGGCVPTRLCETTYNTTAPMYGISLTSGNPVTIVQKFPDLLQQVVYQVCKSEECDVIQGECVQTYLPYLFLVIPLGPVTLTGKYFLRK
ncbi:hypothetical protein Fcan01_14564 [Folsomia candida]|uniref:Uncharacterized protein n=1 Tax=Folsomia candida TaxID=158441 RepID=A0A226E082_FOLCA|nr:hypothetical protein Fcan01_14564 [Folsomia candida]